MGQIGFGVGCLPLVPKMSKQEQCSDVMTTGWWNEKIEAGLGTLPSVTNLEIAIHRIGVRVPRHNDILLAARDYDVDFTASPIEPSHIKFSIVIPKRMQLEVTPWLSRSFECERFEVSIIYGDYGPVTFVRTLDDNEEHGQVAHIVALVREFLKQEFRRTRADLSVYAVGPSPFWAHFMVLPRPSGEYGPNTSWTTTQRGYDLVHFFYSPEESDAEAYDRLKAELSGLLSLYYFLVRSRERRYGRANMVSDLTDTLVSMHNDSGFKAWLRRVFKSGGVARHLLLAVITSRHINSEELRQADAILKGDVDINVLDQIRKKLELEATKDYSPELETAREVAMILEASRKKDYEVAMLSIATALGGTAGAIAALIAG